MHRGCPGTARRRDAGCGAGGPVPSAGLDPGGGNRPGGR